jgi:protein-arginine kinase activator protein McsA
MKTEAIRLKGGKCADCGWNGNIAAFQFHHRDPSEKRFTISSNPKVSWEKYWEEIEKCDLLCANCHMIRHSDNADPQFLKDVENYKGRELVVSAIPWKNQTHIPHSYDHNCQHCDKPFTSSRQVQKYCCPNCQSKGRRKCIRPSKEELKRLIDEMPMTHVGKKYNVSDNAVRKWCKIYQISI